MKSEVKFLNLLQNRETMGSKEILQEIKRARLAKKSGFVVLYKQGYYAEKQPHYAWKFTDNISLAKKYKTFNNAMKRGMYIVKQYPLISIQEIRTFTNAEEGYSMTEEKAVKSWDKKTATEIYETEKKKKHAKKYPEVYTEPLTVTVIKSTEEDDFWK
jgi:hypothetical protein